MILQKYFSSLDERKVARIGFATAFMVMFIITGYLLINDKSTSATVGAVLTLSLGLFCFLPTLESFAAFGLSAQFRKEIDEAERLLELLRASAAVSARSMAMNLAWGHRMGDPGNEVKMSQMSEINDLMDRMQLPADKVSLVQKPFVMMTSFDILTAYCTQVRKMSHDSEMTLLAAKRAIERQNADGDAEAQAETASLERRIQDLQPSANDELYDREIDDIIQYFDQEETRLKSIDARDIDGSVRSTLLDLSRTASKLVQECENARNLTPNIVEYLRANSTY